ncbi:MAG: TldD/PmbA family protein [Thermoprotei archaeon]|nr:MAG: TldD/PmbA family protein [Thermoprotei archaeon]
MIDLLEYAVNIARELGASFAEARGEDSESMRIEVRDRVTKAISYGRIKGISVRVLYNGAWGFSATSILSKDSIKKAVIEAYKVAKKASEKVREPVRIIELPSVKDEVHSDVLVNPADVDPSEKVKDILELHNIAFSLGKEVLKTIRTDYMDMMVIDYYVSSEDRCIVQERCITWIRSWATGKLGAIMAVAREELGSTKGYVIFKKWSQERIAKRLLDIIKGQLEATTPKGGSFPAVLGPNVVGTFVHEAFGHLAEADLALSGSAIVDKIGKKIASDYVTIVDDPTIPDGFGTFKYDHEGVETRVAVLIEKGVVKGLMHNRETAARINATPTGNARAESYDVMPLIRMRNTIMEKGDYTVDELFEGIKFGYYLKSFRGGQANLDGTFQVGIQEAYEIVNGEVGRPVRNMSISGNTLETLMKVDAVAKDFELDYGRCGKGQIAFVSSGGPHVRVKSILVGGRS